MGVGVEPPPAELMRRHLIGFNGISSGTKTRQGVCQRQYYKTFFPSMSLALTTHKLGQGILKGEVSLYR